MFCDNLGLFLTANDVFFDFLTALSVNSFECGDMTEEEEIVFFQGLVNTGLAWSLQGHYGRMAESLIEEGLVTAGGLTDADGYTC